MDQQNKEIARGTSFAVLAYTLWGVLPLYWNLLAAFDPMIILAHRVLWALITITVILAVRKQLKQLLQCFKDWKTILLGITAGLLITGNWFLYIWAVNSGMVLETSFGYYINPIISVFLATVVLREPFGRPLMIAFLLATAGVLLQFFLLGEFPWVAVVLASTFALYGLVKKALKAPPLVSLNIETLVALPLGIAFMVFQGGFTGSVEPSGLQWLFLLGSGPLTALPLLLFTSAAQKIPLVMIGFLQYLAPTIGFFLGVFIFKETFDLWKLLSFALIWGAVGVFTWDQFNQARKRKLNSVSVKIPPAL